MNAQEKQDRRDDRLGRRRKYAAGYDPIAAVPLSDSAEEVRTCNNCANGPVPVSREVWRCGVAGFDACPQADRECREWRERAP